jgi:hypothetical protein
VVFAGLSFWYPDTQAGFLAAFVLSAVSSWIHSCPLQLGFGALIALIKLSLISFFLIEGERCADSFAFGLPSVCNGHVFWDIGNKDIAVLECSSSLNDLRAVSTMLVKTKVPVAIAGRESTTLIRSSLPVLIPAVSR